MKIINLFAVCLITLTVLFPSLTVFGMVWEQHLKFVEIQQNIDSSSHSIKSEYSAFPLQTNYLTKSDFSNLYLNQNEINTSVSKKHQIRDFWRWLFLFLPFCIVVATYLYDRYLVYRANIFQQQVDLLEKIWHQSLEK